MSKILFLLFVVLLLAFFLPTPLRKPVLDLFSSPAYATEPVKEPFKVGETVTYNIKKLGVKVGEAVLTYKGTAKFENHSCILITFTSTGPKFYDKELLCLEPETFLPLLVKRDINIFGKKEKIREEYSQKEGSVKIVKQTGDMTVEQTLTKNGNIENIYGFIYRYRKEGNFKTGDEIKINLPTKDVVIEVKDQGEIEINRKKYNAYLLQSKPAQYTLWFDPGSRKIPLRIDGAAGMSKTSMILKSYREK